MYQNVMLCHPRNVSCHNEAGMGQELKKELNRSVGKCPTIAEGPYRTQIHSLTYLQKLHVHLRDSPETGLFVVILEVS